jgi:ectoine hydroxylase-related dioxygenase (phytanoyl-CoA dioxygenase family)
VTTTTSTSSQTTGSGYLRAEDCHLDELLAIIGAGTDLADYPHAADVAQGVLLYDADRLREAMTDDDARRSVQAEVARALAQGPGITVYRGAFEEDVLDRVSTVFERIIAQERAGGGPAGDHFAAPGANDRVWNALEKLAVTDPEAFVDYYANDIVALVSTAWLGPGYQVNSQVNVVNPGGAGQTVHRDYHLGFQSPKASAEFPAHVHGLSPVLTLQGAVAHCDMPVETGPTLYLPHSQKYAHGYLAYWLPEFQEYFVDNHVQLPLAKGDAVFFNPALFHGAGTNVSADIQRVANLLQVSSAFGRAMETVDRNRVLRAIYPVLLERRAAGMPEEALARALASAAEGYPFPTNLDLDQPVGGMTPASQAELAARALASGTPADDLAAVLDGYAARRTTS